jgi:hypothetical protein
MSNHSKSNSIGNMLRVGTFHTGDASTINLVLRVVGNICHQQLPDWARDDFIYLKISHLYVQIG